MKIPRSDFGQVLRVCEPSKDDEDGRMVCHVSSEMSDDSTEEPKESKVGEDEARAPLADLEDALEEDEQDSEDSAKGIPFIDDDASSSVLDESAGIEYRDSPTHTGSDPVSTEAPPTLASTARGVSCQPAAEQVGRDETAGASDEATGASTPQEPAPGGCDDALSIVHSNNGGGVVIVGAAVTVVPGERCESDCDVNSPDESATNEMRQRQGEAVSDQNVTYPKGHMANGVVSQTECNGVASKTLKSALKRVDGDGTRKGKGRRVSFNESLNKFFDADYVIFVEDDDEPRLVNVKGFDLNFPEVFAFEPPLEFIDQVTLSPPEGYKDVVANHSHDENLGEESESESSIDTRSEDEDLASPPSPSEERKNDERSTKVAERNSVQDGSSSTPELQRYIVETITLTTVTERRVVREAPTSSQSSDASTAMDESASGSQTSSPSSDSQPELETTPSKRHAKRGGILKGGKLWKSSDVRLCEKQTSFSEPYVSFKEDSGDQASRRSVRFSEKDDAEENSIPEQQQQQHHQQQQQHHNQQQQGNSNQDEKQEIEDPREASSPDSTELTLTFKLGSHVLVANSLKPNSAVRQLFPSPKFLSPPVKEVVRIKELCDVETYRVPEYDGMGQAQDSSLTSPDGQESKASDSEASVPNDDYGTVTFTAVIPPTSAQAVCSDDSLAGGIVRTNSQIRRTIERNALRRSLVRYLEPRKRTVETQKVKSDSSLVDKIKQLTCDVDEEDETGEAQNQTEPTDNTQFAPMCRTSPTGEESNSATKPLYVITDQETTGLSVEKQDKGTSTKQSCIDPKHTQPIRFVDKSCSPSASSTSSSSSGSSSAYKKLAEFFTRKSDKSSDKQSQTHDAQSPEAQHFPEAKGKQEDSWMDVPAPPPPPAVKLTHDFGVNTSCFNFREPTYAPSSGGGVSNFVGPKTAASRMSATAEARKQFLSTLAPFPTRSGDGRDASEYLVNSAPGDRTSVASQSTVAETYSLDDIEEVLNGENPVPDAVKTRNSPTTNEPVYAPPDIVPTGTASNPDARVNGEVPKNEADSAGEVDELVLFVQQDMGRIERIKKRYSLSEDDQDDYGFSRRPSVRGIKPRFGSTTEILQQIQSQMQPPPLACQSRAGSHITWPYSDTADNSRTEQIQDIPASSPVTAPTNRDNKRRGMMPGRPPGMLPILQEESYYSGSNTLPNDYRNSYVDYKSPPMHQQPDVGSLNNVRNDATYSHMYSSTGNLYHNARNGDVPRQQFQHPPPSHSPPPSVLAMPNSNGAGTPPQAYPPMHGNLLKDPYPTGFHDPRLQSAGSVQSLDRNSGIYGSGRRVPMRSSPVSGPPVLVGSSPVEPLAGTPPMGASPTVEHCSTLPHPGRQSRSPAYRGPPMGVAHPNQQVLMTPARSESPQRSPPKGTHPQNYHHTYSPSSANQPFVPPTQRHQSPIAGTYNYYYPPPPPNCRYYPPNGPPYYQQLPRNQKQYNEANSVYGQQKQQVPHQPPQQQQQNAINLQQQRQMSTSPVPYANANHSPTRNKQERGVPEGASSSPGFAQDSLCQGPPPRVQNSTTVAQSPSTSVYYALNV